MIKDHYAVVIQTRWRAHKAFDDYQRLILRIKQCSYHIQYCVITDYINYQDHYRCDICLNCVYGKGYGCRDCDVDMCKTCFNLCNGNHIS